MFSPETLTPSEDGVFVGGNLSASSLITAKLFDPVASRGYIPASPAKPR
jgi:hypothetical protein